MPGSELHRPSGLGREAYPGLVPYHCAFAAAFLVAGLNLLLNLLPRKTATANRGRKPT